MLPPQALERLSLTAARITSFYHLVPIIGVALFVLGAIMMIRLPKEARVALSLILFVLGFGFIGSFEFLREAARKPYVIHGYMYSNQIRVQDVPSSTGPDCWPLPNGSAPTSATPWPQAKSSSSCNAPHVTPSVAP
ncbi:hypothetical protein [Salidesulfovibrio brasiliensis]|uniref:hypothetical protein n=1 Tax=Salidesulfovibrio brasiliensis TaxID=221711 RepID=UPI000A6840FE|nr:hypothetical protein [Salidesulfovibrio brasiliensis]